jgi:S1-C subfamily serine protease
MIDAILMLMCGMEQGTVFATDRGVITAAHVATAGHCNTGTAVLGRVSTDHIRDVAIMRSSQTYPTLRVSCEGIVAGQEYTIIGYPRYNNGERITMAVTATGRTRDISGFISLSSFRGRIVKGMSGAPILNATGDVVAVATATAGEYTYGQSLANTEICQ